MVFSPSYGQTYSKIVIKSYQRSNKDIRNEGIQNERKVTIADYVNQQPATECARY